MLKKIKIKRMALLIYFILFSFFFYAQIISAGLDLKQKKGLSAIKKWGPSLIFETDDSKRADVYKSTIIPWSSDWLPFASMTLFLGEDSTNAQYDKYARTIGVQSCARQKEQEIHFNEQRHVKGVWPDYAGHCIGRAIAACTYPGPIGNYTDEKNGLKIKVTHIQNMLTQTCDYIPNLHIYGELNEEGSDLNNMYPEEFHRFLEVQLVENGLPVIINFDYRPKIRWYVPIYKAEISASFKRVKGELYKEIDEATGEELYGMNVHTKVTWADYKNYNPERCMTVPFDGKEYHYLLLGTKEGEGIRVKKGRWIMSSTADHPGCAVMLPSKEDMKKRCCSNTEIKTEIVDSLYEKALQQYVPSNDNSDEVITTKCNAYASDHGRVSRAGNSKSSSSGLHIVEITHETRDRPAVRPAISPKPVVTPEIAPNPVVVAHPEVAIPEVTIPEIVATPEVHVEEPVVARHCEENIGELEKNYSRDEYGFLLVIQNENSEYVENFIKENRDNIQVTTHHLMLAYENSPILAQKLYPYFKASHHKIEVELLQRFHRLKFYNVKDKSRINKRLKEMSKEESEWKNKLKI